MEIVKRIKADRLAALVELGFHSAGRGSIVIEESATDHSGEGQGVHRGFRVSALINGTGRRVLGESRVGSQVSRTADGIGRSDGKGVAIAGNTKGNLVRRETGGDPSLDSLGGGASLEGRARVIQRSVGTDASTPLTLWYKLLDMLSVQNVRGTYIDIVVHDGDVIENLSELGHIGHGLTIGTSEWGNRNGGGEVEILSCRLRAQFLEEG